jgi:hypothetical protein
MKVLYNLGAIVSILFAAVGAVKAWQLGPGSSLSIAILAFPAAIALSFGLYIFQLQCRIAALEKRLRELP